jgi:DNA polymerase III sliding clamp (beta) subunit (PCNA family)
MSRVMVKREHLLDSLLKIIATCERVHQSGKAASLPHFFYIRLDGYGEAIRLSAQNLHRRIEVMLKSISPHEPFCLGIPGEGFIALIKNLYDEHIELAVGGEGGLHLKVITPKCTYRLAAMDQDRFPASEVVTIKDWQKASFEDLFQCFSRIIYCTSADESSRPHVRALCVTEDCFFCTDGYRISLIPNRIVRTPYPIMIPTESVKSFTTLFRDGGDDGYVFIEEQRLHFSKEGIYATTNLYNSQIPNYKSVVPSGACLTVVFRPSLGGNLLR